MWFENLSNRFNFAVFSADRWVLFVYRCNLKNNHSGQMRKATLHLCFHRRNLSNYKRRKFRFWEISRYKGAKSTKGYVRIECGSVWGACARRNLFKPLHTHIYTRGGQNNKVDVPHHASNHRQLPVYRLGEQQIQQSLLFWKLRCVLEWYTFFAHRKRVVFLDFVRLVNLFSIFGFTTLKGTCDSFKIQHVLKTFSFPKRKNDFIYCKQCIP